MKAVHVFAGVLGTLASLAAQLPAAAQADYPNRPLTMIVPFPAGGRTDLVGRIVAQELTKHIGRPVAVVNKPGASSVLGARSGRISAGRLHAWFLFDLGGDGAVHRTDADPSVRFQTGRHRQHRSGSGGRPTWCALEDAEVSGRGRP